MFELLKVIEEIKSQARCEGCPLYGKRYPSIIEPYPSGGLSVVVVTESPWENINEVEDAVSVYNVPTFPYLYCLLGGSFRPRESANSYWTHVCKCHLKGASSGEKRSEINSRLLRGGGSLKDQC
ncbi:MAG: hypothetical protein QXV88_06935 [Candidatus Bathyarchaeia archaeon]